MTPEMLMRCTASRPDRAANLAPFLTAAMAEFEINTPARQAAFLAQIAHESMRLRFLAEIWGPTPAQLRYERDPSAPWPSSPNEAKQPQFDRNRLAYTLGNVNAGDGKRFKGRGPIQITGHTNYIGMGAKLGADLEHFPELLDEPGMACRSAGAFWQSRGLNELADQGNFEIITRRINGGTNGLDEREALWTDAKAALGVAS